MAKKSSLVVGDLFGIAVENGLLSEEIVQLIALLHKQMHISGEVDSVTTTATSGTVVIVEREDGTFTSFSFPPNPQMFLDELKRAQSGGLRVGVSYVENAQGRIIQSVTVYRKKKVF